MDIEKEKIIVVFETTNEEDKFDGFNKTWIRQFNKIETAKKEIMRMNGSSWRVNRVYKGKRIRI